MLGKKNPHTAERLADVLALIQVLALDPKTHRSEPNLKSELQGLPRSLESWTQVATEHPEFFRVSGASGFPVSLVARHVIPKDSTGTRPMPSDMTYRLMQAAIDLYDREASESRRWDQLVAVAVGGIIGLMPGLIAAWIGVHHAVTNCAK